MILKYYTENRGKRRNCFQYRCIISLNFYPSVNKMDESNFVIKEMRIVKIITNGRVRVLTHLAFLVLLYPSPLPRAVSLCWDTTNTTRWLTAASGWRLEKYVIIFRFEKLFGACRECRNRWLSPLAGDTRQSQQIKISSHQLLEENRFIEEVLTDSFKREWFYWLTGPGSVTESVDT